MNESPPNASLLPSLATTRQRGPIMRSVVIALGIIIVLGLGAVLSGEVFPALQTLAAWQAGCY